MTSPNADLLLHPIRLRILVAMVGRQLTVQQLGLVMPEVPQATLYRQLNKLVQAGVLDLVEERPVRGTIEKVYTARKNAGLLSPEVFAAAGHDEHMRYFTSFVAALIGDLWSYLGQPRVEPVADGLGYSEMPLYLSDAELAQLHGALGELLGPILANAPGPGRRRRTLALIMIPSAEREPADPAEEQ